MKKRRRVLAILMCCMMVLAMMPGMALGATVNSSESVTLTINKSYSREMLHVDQQGGYDINSCTISSGSLPAGISTGYSSMEGVYLKGTPTKAGTSTVVFRIRLSNENTILHTVTIKVIDPNAVYTSSENLSLTYYGNYTRQMLKVDNKGDTIKSVSLTSGSLPAGMDWNWSSMDGVYIKGTPTKSGTYKVVFQCRLYESGTVNHTVNITVSNPPTTNSTENLALTVGKSYSREMLTIDMQGQEIKSCSLISGTLPAGITWSWSSMDGVYVKGTPTAAGTAKVIFQVELGAKGIVKHTVNFTVQNPPAYTSSENLTFTVGQKVNRQMLKVDSHGAAIQSCTLTSGTMPAGMTWNWSSMDGIHLDGTPTKAGTAKLVFQVKLGAAGTVTHTVNITIKEKDSPTPANPFADVASGAYYYEAVLWAVNHNPQITNGTDPTHFSPDVTCTRGQVVTFLWRAKGCPEPKTGTNPFDDVSPDVYYYKAVLWAVEKGITNGTSGTTFGPDDPCQRCQVVTFLWRADGQPKPGSSSNPFVDVHADDYFYNAVLWAVNHDPQITNGLAADWFGFNQPCSRGQIVTFLYRAMA